jgi:SAM-dependent methyltransferase
MNCRHCGVLLKNIFLDLGRSPPSNAYLTKNNLHQSEIYYPLKVLVCDQCWLVQTEDYINAEKLFTSQYAYFSSTSPSWLVHAKNYTDKIIKELNLNSKSYVIEIASNDGYLLKNFVAAKISCLGIEPTTSTAEAAEKIGIPVLRNFFGKSLAHKLALDEKKADLIIGNNVYAHVPDINDFTMGLKEILKTDGTITLEFPHLKNLIEYTQFDTIYHEHFSYLSLYTVCKIFQKASLRIFNVEKLKTHGGSLRVYGCHFDDIRKTKNSVTLLLQEEKLSGLQKIETYKGFHISVDKIKSDLIKFLTEQKKKGKKVVAYGAAAKGNTLLNYAGIKEELLPFVFDAAISKQGCFLPGSHIPILSPEYIIQTKADYVLILPWNIAEEIVIENFILKKNGVQFVIAVPELKIL